MALDESPQDPFEPIAIIGVGAILPDAPDAEVFWQNIIDIHVSIREVPEHRWVVADHWVEGGQRMSLKARHTLRLEDSLKILNSTGVDGAFHLAH